MSVSDLESMIQGAINSFESERSCYWESEDSAQYLELADAIARQMVAASEDLVKPEGQPEIPLDWHHYLWLAGIEAFRETVFEADGAQGEGLRSLAVLNDRGGLNRPLP